MELQTLNCNHCGAPLQVPRSANYVTCNHCSAQLRVKRTDSSAFTEQLDQLENNQSEMLAKLDRIERESQIAKLDREWEQTREQYLVTSKGGDKRVPSKDGADLGMVLIIVLGLFLILRTAAASPPMLLVTVLVIAGGVGMCLNHRKRADDYHRAHRAYQQRRDDIMGES